MDPAPPACPAAIARSILARRASLTRFIDPVLCVDPAVDMLLLLYVAAAEGTRTTTTACCEAVRTPRATGLRWIAKLEEHGLLSAGGDPADRRVTLLRLTDKGRTAMEAWIRDIDAL